MSEVWCSSTLHFDRFCCCVKWNRYATLAPEIEVGVEFRVQLWLTLMCRDILLLQLYYAPRRVHPFYDHGAVRPILPVCLVVPPRMAYSNSNSPDLRCRPAESRTQSSWDVNIWRKGSEAVFDSESYLASLFSTCFYHASASLSKRNWCHFAYLPYILDVATILGQVTQWPWL